MPSSRAGRRLRHGGAFSRVELGAAEDTAGGVNDELERLGAALEPPDEHVLAVDEALERLEARSPEKARLVELRYFAGLSVDETAAALGTSAASVERDWRFVKAWLQEELERGSG